MPITALYAALLTPLLVVLSVRVIALRREAGAPLGDGGDPLLLRRMRVQANFAEYVPFALVLLVLAESLHTQAWLLHALGSALVLARLLHAVGVSRTPERFGLRVAGVGLTFGVLGVTGLACFLQAVVPR